MVNKDFDHDEFAIQRDLWAVLKKHYNDVDQAAADSSYSEICEIRTRYGEDPFCMKMADVVMFQLQRRWDELHGKGWR